MLKRWASWPIAVFLAFAFSTSLQGHGVVWNFLGDAHIDGAQDHEKIRVGRVHDTFRAVQLRVDGDAIFLERIVVYFDDGTSEKLAIGGRIPDGGTHTIDLSGEPRGLESVELWYIQEPCEHRPQVMLYGTH